MFAIVILMLVGIVTIKVVAIVCDSDSTWNNYSNITYRSDRKGNRDNKMYHSNNSITECDSNANAAANHNESLCLDWKLNQFNRTYPMHCVMVMRLVIVK